MKTLLLALTFTVSLSVASAQSGPVLTDENSDLYLGYYFEDTVNNPEDTV